MCGFRFLKSEWCASRKLHFPIGMFLSAHLRCLCVARRKLQRSSVALIRKTAWCQGAVYFCVSSAAVL